MVDGGDGARNRWVEPLGDSCAIARHREHGGQSDRIDAVEPEARRARRCAERVSAPGSDQPTDEERGQATGG
eukprot:15477139-Alexandrium_andersonii.AAC.1